MDFRTLRSALQAQHESLTSVRSAPVDPPRYLKELPAIISWPGGFQAIRQNLTGNRSSIDYRGGVVLDLDIFVAQLQEGQGHTAQALETSEEVMQQLFELYRALAADNTPLPQGCHVMMDNNNPFELGGFAEMVYVPNGPTFSGFRATIRVSCGLDD